MVTAMLVRESLTYWKKTCEVQFVFLLSYSKKIAQLNLHDSVILKFIDT